MGNKNKNKAFRAPLRNESSEESDKKPDKKKDKSLKSKKAKSPPLMENIISSSGNVVEEQPLTGTSPKLLLTQNEPQPNDEAQLHNPSQGNAVDLLKGHKNDTSKKQKKKKVEVIINNSAITSKLFSNTMSSDSDDDLGKKLQNILEGITSSNNTNIDKPQTVNENSDEPNTIESSETIIITKPVKRVHVDEIKSEKDDKNGAKPKKKKKKLNEPNTSEKIPLQKQIKKKNDKKNKKKHVTEIVQKNRMEEVDTNKDTEVVSVINTNKDIQVNNNAHSTELDTKNIVSENANMINEECNNSTEDKKVKDLRQPKTHNNDKALNNKNVDENTNTHGNTENVEDSNVPDDTDCTDNETELLKRTEKENECKLIADKLKMAEKVKNAEFWKTAKSIKDKKNDLEIVNKDAKKSNPVIKIKKSAVKFKKVAVKKTSKSKQKRQAQMSQELLLKSSQYPLFLSSQPSRTLSHYERLLWLRQRRGMGLWVRCDRLHDGTLCNKWRYLPDYSDPTELPDKWYCDMHPDPAQASCSAKEFPPSLKEQEDMIYNLYTAGSIVWARADGYPWWPAMVDDCVDTEQYYWLDSYSDVPTHYNVVFFDLEPTRCWLPTIKIHAMNSSTPPNGRICHNRLYEKRIQEATIQALAARTLTIKERLKKYSFLSVYQGEILTPEIHASTQESQQTVHSVLSTRSSQKRKGPKTKLDELSESLRTLICSLNPEENTNTNTVPLPAAESDDSESSNDSSSSESDEEDKIPNKNPVVQVSSKPQKTNNATGRTPDLFLEGEQTEDVDVSNRATAGRNEDDELICFSQRAKRNSEPSELKDLSDLIAVQKSLNPPSIPGILHKKSSDLSLSSKYRDKKGNISTNLAIP